MSRRSPFAIVLNEEERRELEVLAVKQKAEARMVLRARVVLAAADGDDNVDIAWRFEIAPNTVLKWRKRFFEEGMKGLADRKRSGRPRGFSPSGERRGQTARL
jgi:transposase